MEVGIKIPHTGQQASARFVPEFCAAAEAAGFDGLWTVDHVVAPMHTDSTYTLAPTPTKIADGAVAANMGLNLEMNTTLAIASAVTERVRLCTGVAVLPIHNAVLNARQLASIDQYSGGRVVYGVGVGWLREEAEAMGMPWDRRGARTDEHIALMRALWTADDDVVGFSGEFHQLPPMSPEPRPVQRPIPILIGGHSGPALDRAARIGDGWIAAGMSPSRLQTALEQLTSACDRHGRDPADLQIMCSTRRALDTALGAITEQTARVVETLLAYAPLVTHVSVGIGGVDRGAMLEMLDLYGREVLPHVR